MFKTLMDLNLYAYRKRCCRLLVVRLDYQRLHLIRCMCCLSVWVWVMGSVWEYWFSFRGFGPTQLSLRLNGVQGQICSELSPHRIPLNSECCIKVECWHEVSELAVGYIWAICFQPALLFMFMLLEKWAKLHLLYWNICDFVKLVTTTTSD